MPARSRHPFLDTAGPVGFAHRGGAEEAPENTLPAFEAAVALGYRYLETDVHLSLDGVLMAFHDAALDRVTDSRGRLAELPAAAIEAADAGHHFSSRDGGHPFRGRGVTVPRLETLLDHLPTTRINIDAKDDRCVEPLVDLLVRHDALGRVCIGSFSDARLLRLRRLAGPGLCTSMGPRAVAMARIGSLSGRMRAAGALCLQLPLRERGVPLVDRRMVTTAHRMGLAVHVWTVDDETTMEALLELGVDGIMTDRPRVLRDVMGRRGWSVAGGALPTAAASHR